MTEKENLFLAKKIFTELVFNTAYIEGVNVTFPQTQTILDGAIVSNIAVSDIQTVLNLKHAWQYLLNTLDAPFDFTYLCKINEEVSRNESLDWGCLRTGNVGISGTDYVPPIPNEAEVQEQLQDLTKIQGIQERAIALFCFVVHAQLFWDGNKRTATIVANKLLIPNGAGVLTIGTADALDFNESLKHFYDTGDRSQLVACLRACIKTLDIPERTPPKKKTYEQER